MNSVKYSVLFLMPIIKTKIWAGSRLSNFVKDYGNNVGEVWLCSGLEDNSNIITNLDENITLRDFWFQHKEYFADSIVHMQEFPLLVKFIDAGADLSVQLHPNYKDECSYLNKNEAWYVLDCMSDSKILYGHKATTVSEFQQKYFNKNYDELFHFEKIAPGQVWYIPSGTIHAIMADTLILEVQQPSDITYRLYDYDRLGEDGNLRELHVDKVYEHLSCDNQDYLQQKLHNNNLKLQDNTLQSILSTAYFRIYRIFVNERCGFKMPEGFLCCQIVQGSGSMVVNTTDGVLRQYDIAIGTSFVLLNTITHVEFIGHMMIMIESQAC